METGIISLFPLNSSSSFSLIFFLWVKYSLISYVTSLFSSSYLSLPSLITSGGSSSACLTEGRYPCKTAEAFFLHHPNYVCVSYSINSCHNLMLLTPFLSCPHLSWRATYTKDMCNKQFSCWMAAGSDWDFYSKYLWCKCEGDLRKHHSENTKLCIVILFRRKLLGIETFLIKDHSASN